MNETFEQFSERMSHVEKTEEIIVGSRHAGNTRTIFEFEGHRCHLETYNMPNYSGRVWREIPPVVACLNAVMHPPSIEWVHGEWIKGKKAAEALAKQYDGKACPDEYHEDDQDAWYLRFIGENGFEKMMRLIFDYKTGILPVETFPWKAEAAKQGVGAA